MNNKTKSVIRHIFCEYEFEIIANTNTITITKSKKSNLFS